MNITIKTIHKPIRELLYIPSCGVLRKIFLKKGITNKILCYRGHLDR